MAKKAAIGMAVLAVLAAAGWLLFKPAVQTNQPSGYGDTAQPDMASPDQPASPALLIGSPGAKITIIEYGDFKCPVCNRFFQDAGRQIKDNYINTGKAKLEFRSLSQIGPDSAAAARASYCAAEQGKFPAYHDALFNYIGSNYYRKGNTKAEYEEVFTSQKLKELAAVSGADAAKFGRCLDSNKFAALEQSVAAAGRQAGFNTTPTFVINGRRITGAQPYSVFKAVLDAQ